jgi:hypothetical protein
LSFDGKNMAIFRIFRQFWTVRDFILADVSVDNTGRKRSRYTIRALVGCVSRPLRFIQIQKRIGPGYTICAELLPVERRKQIAQENDFASHVPPI